MSTKTLLTRIITHLKGGDESKIQRFLDRLDRFHREKITDLEKEITTLKGSIEDKKAEYNEAMLDINIDKIKLSTDVEAYCDKYTNNLLELKAKQAELEKEVRGKEKEIEVLKGLRTDLESAQEV